MHRTDNTDPSTVEDGARRIALLSDPIDTQDDEEAQGSASAEHDTDESDESETDASEAIAESDEADDSADDSEESEEQPDASDTEETDESESDDDTPAEKPRTFKVPTSEGEVEVDEPELIRGYQRQSDYTRKTQAVAEKSKQVEAQRQHYAAGLERLATLLKSDEPTPEQWARLRDENPIEFAARYAEHQQQRERLAALHAERNRVLEEAQAAAEEERVERIRSEGAALIERLPEWRNEEVRTREQQKIKTFGKSLGYTDEDLDNIDDHRLILVVRDAMLYREHLANKAKVQERVKEKVKQDKPKVIKPGTSRSDSKSVRRTQATKAVQRLRQSGRVEDAAAAIEALDF